MVPDKIRNVVNFEYCTGTGLDIVLCADGGCEHGSQLENLDCAAECNGTVSGDSVSMGSNRRTQPGATDSPDSLHTSACIAGMDEPADGIEIAGPPRDALVIAAVQVNFTLIIVRLSLMLLRPLRMQCVYVSLALTRT